MKHELKPFNELFLAAISPNTSLIPLTGNKKAFTHAQFTNEQLSAMWMLFVSACSGNTSRRGATPQSAAGLFLGASVVTTIGDMTLVLVLVLGLVLVLFAASRVSPSADSAARKSLINCRASSIVDRP